MEALCLDVPLLDPTGDFSGPRAPGSFLPVKDVWIPYYWFLCKTSHITCLNGFNDRGTRLSRSPERSDNPGPVGSSQLRGRSDACFLIDMHASIKAGTEWIKYTNDGCYGTDHIPITPQFLLVAFRFTPRGSEEIWSAHSAVAPAANTHTPAAFLPHSSSIGSAQQDSRADVRLRAHLHAPPATIIPAEDDDELLDATLLCIQS